jgi:hypothetical protein
MSLPARLLLVLGPALGVCLVAVPAADPSPRPGGPAAVPNVRPLPRNVSAGLTFLLRKQNADGGWDGGAVASPFVTLPFAPNPPRKGPKQAAPESPSNVADTSIALLALLRAGHRPGKGDQGKRLSRAVDFVCKQIEAADDDSLSVTDVKGTLVQTKIGPYVDTFVAAVALAEVHGKMATEKEEQRVTKALEKVVKKMEKNQKEDGSWEGRAWAPVLSQALASRAINRASQVGIRVDDAVLERTAGHARKEFEALAKALNQPAPGGPGVARPRPGTTPFLPAVGFPVGMGALEGAAGVSLYATAAHVGAMMDSAVTTRQAADHARGILNSPSATPEERKLAKAQVERLPQVQKDLNQAMTTVAKQANNPQFVRGFGSDGGEEFLSFMLLGETFRATGNRNGPAWDRTIRQRLQMSQNADGSWSGKHCITGSTFCTSAAVLTLMNDRSPLPLLTGPGGK